MDFLSLPDELKTEILKFCDLQNVVLVCKSLYNFVVQNKSLNEKFELKIDGFSQNTEQKEEFLASTRKFISAKISTDLNENIFEVCEKVKKDILNLDLRAALKNQRMTEKYIFILRKFVNLEKLSFSLNSDYADVRPGTYFSISNLGEMPGFSMLKKLTLKAYYPMNLHYDGPADKITSKLDIINIFVNATKLTELVIYHRLKNDGILLVRQRSLKILRLICDERYTTSLLQGLRTEEIADSIQFSLRILEVENLALYKHREEFIEFMKTQKSIERFSFRLYYADYCAQETVPIFLSDTLNIKSLYRLHLSGTGSVHVGGRFFNPSIKVMDLGYDLGECFKQNFDKSFPNLETLIVSKNVKVAVERLDKLKFLRVSSLDYLDLNQVKSKNLQVFEFSAVITMDNYTMLESMWNRYRGIHFVYENLDFKEANFKELERWRDGMIARMQG